MRLKQFGTQVLVGDLAIPKEMAHLIEMEVVDEEVEADDEEELVQPRKDHRDLVVDVTEDNIHEFSISQIVMPLVGYDVRMPKNMELAKIITDVMQNDGMTIQHF